MKKSKLLNLILRGGGGGGSSTSSDVNKTGVTSTSDPGDLDRDPLYTHDLTPEPGVLVRQSTRRKNRPPPQVVPQLRQAVERSTSWKYTNDQSPDSFTVNSSPSILDAIRSQQEQQNNLEPQVALIEKSQSWSGDRLLESATDSGSSRGGTNNNSRAGSGSRAGSRTGTLSYPRTSVRDRGSRTGSRVGSDHGGDSTPSSIYDHDHYVSYTDADGYENVELSSPQKIDSGDNSSSHESGSKLHGSRLSVKGSTRRSRRPSPRRSPLAAELGDNLEISENGASRTGSVRTTVPSISLSTSSPLLLRNNQRTSPQRSPHRSPRRTPSQRSPASVSPSHNSPVPRSPSQRSPTIEFPASASRSSSHSPSRSSSRMGSRRSSRSPNRPARPVSNERWHEADERASPLTNNSRSLSYEEQNMKIPLPKPLWKTRSWQQPRNQALQISERVPVTKTGSYQPHSVRVPQQVSLRLDPRPRAHNMITRQEALPPHVFTKSRSWQQSHDPDPLPEPLSRTYTVHDRRNPRRSSGRLAPSTTRGSSISPGRYPMNTQISLQVQPGRSMYYQDDRSNYHQPPSRGQSAYVSSSVSNANGPADYVELRDYELLEKQQSIRAAEQYRLEQKRQEKMRQEQLRQEAFLREKYQQEKRLQNDHHLMTQDQYVRRFHQAPFTQQLSFSNAYSQQNYPQTPTGQHQSQLTRQRSGSQRSKLPPQEHPKIYPPREFMNDNQNQDEYASLRDVQERKGSTYHLNPEDKSHAPPIKSASLMSSVELLNTLKRQLALSSPTKAGRSKSMEAGRAAAAALASENHTPDPEPTAELSSTTLGSSLPSGRLSPALQALVAEKRARLKRSTVAFSGSGRARFAILRTIASPSTRCTVAFIPFYLPLTLQIPPITHAK